MTTMINPQMEPLFNGLPSAEPALFEQTVPPGLVHRVSGRDVFVTQLRVLGHNTFQVGVRMPGSHAFYGPTTPDTHDPLMFLESVRQAGLLVAHVAFDIPRDNKFVIHENQFSMDPTGLRTNGGRPVDVQLIVTAHDIRRRGRGFAGMRFAFACMRDGVQVASAEYVWSCVSASGYDKLRGAYRTAMPPSRAGAALVAPAQVGRHDEVDVMLGDPAGEGRWMARIAPDHYSVYDHHFDHVPGTGVFEMARQAALLVLRRPSALPIRGKFAFQHYIEFDKPCQVSAEVEETGADRTTTTLRIVFEQDGHVAAEGIFDMRVAG